MNIQTVEGVGLENRLYSCDRDEAPAVIKAMMVDWRFQLCSTCSVTVTKRVLQNFDLVGSDTDVEVLVSGFVKAKDVNSWAHIVFILFYYIAFVVLLRGQTQGAQQVGFSGATCVVYWLLQALHESGVHIWKLGLPLFACVKGALTCLKLHLFHDDAMRTAIRSHPFLWSREWLCIWWCRVPVVS